MSHMPFNKYNSTSCNGINIKYVSGVQLENVSKMIARGWSTVSFNVSIASHLDQQIQVHKFGKDNFMIYC